jgi:hypothetical protein
MGINWERRYLTKSAAYDMNFVAQAGTDFVRGVDIARIGNDAFEGTRFVVNCTVDDQDPGTTGWHADVWQNPLFAADEENIILYNIRATNLHYQPMNINSTTSASPVVPARNIAIVNCYMSMTTPIPAGGGTLLWQRQTDHLLIWNSTFLNCGFAIYDDREPDFSTRKNGSITNMSVRGTVFDFFTWQLDLAGTSIDFSDWRDNHFIKTNSRYSGTAYTTGNALLDAVTGRPLAGSPLLNRLATPVVPIDAGNGVRSSPADAGAYEQ